MIARKREKQLDAALKQHISNPIYARLLKAQAIHETGWFSFVPRGTNNLWGIRRFKRNDVKYITIQHGKEGEIHYIKFKSIEACLLHLDDMYQRLSVDKEAWRRHRGNPSKFIGLVAPVYCPFDKKYGKKWRHHYDRLEKKEKQIETVTIKKANRKGVSNMEQYISLITKFVSRRVGLAAGTILLLAEKGGELGLPLSICIASVAIAFIAGQTYLDGRKK